jgi:hypothetical protein
MFKCVTRWKPERFEILFFIVETKILFKKIMALDCYIDWNIRCINL